MVLVAIIGELGCGKTLALTFLAWHNYQNKGKKIFSNYKFKTIPFEYVSEAEDINNMHSGFFAGDELWLWLDSRSSHSKKNKFISSILIKSRKRNLEIVYTTQSFFQIDVRVRNITDFIITPVLSKSERTCKLLWYTKESFMMNKPVKIIKFKTKDFFDMYDTTEEIEPID
jgi:hypothetical protein